MRSQSARRRAMMRRGFTLIEVLVSVVILAIITGIVFAAFSSVTAAVDATRVGAEELRLRQFLTRNLVNNFTTAYYSYFSTDRELIVFEGVDEEGSNGPADSVRFFSSGGLVGGAGLPGDLKEVRYEVTRQGGDDELEFDDETNDEKRPDMLQSTETPILASGGVSEEGDLDAALTADTVEAPSWTVPVRTFDVKYYDGAADEWVDEWYSVEAGRLPWCVDIRINFARTEDQLAADRKEGFDIEKDPDFEMVIPIPQGMGIVEDFDVVNPPAGQMLLTEPSASRDATPRASQNEEE